MDQQSTYGIRTELDLPYERAVEKVTGALKREGFGVLSEIDMKEELKEKLNVDYKRYVILGACNPPLAYKALQAEPEIENGDWLGGLDEVRTAAFASLEKRGVTRRSYVKVDSSVSATRA